MAMAWASNDFSAYVNALSDLIDATVTVPSGLTTLGIGLDEAGTGFQPFVPISSIRYWSRRLENAQLQSMTA